MKNIFQALALYNKSVNETLMGLLKGLSKDQIMMETKAFFHSIYETFVHTVTTDLIWLRRYEKIYPDIKCLKSNELLSLDDVSMRKEFGKDYRAAFEIRKRADALIEEFIHEINEQNFIRAIQYKNYKGEHVEKILWQALLHWFNHQTHHRGNISVMLDFLGVDNDFSSLITRV